MVLDARYDPASYEREDENDAERIRAHVARIRNQGETKLILAGNDRAMAYFRHKLLREGPVDLSHVTTVHIKEESAGAFESIERGKPPTDHSVHLIADILQHIPNLTSLDCAVRADVSGRPVFSGKGMEGILDSVAGSGLRSLNIDRCVKSEGIGRALGDLLERQPGLEALTLGMVPLADEDVREMARGLHAAVNLRRLYMVKTSVFNVSHGDESAFALAAALAGADKLEELKIENTHIGTQGLQALVDAVAPLPSLKKFAFNYHLLGPDAGAPLAQLIAQSPSLEQFRATGLALGDEAMPPIAAALKRNQRITHVDFEHNGITPEGTKTFMEGALAEPSSIVKVDFYQQGQNVQEVIMDAIADAERFPSYLPNLLSARPVDASSLFYMVCPGRLQDVNSAIGLLNRKSSLNVQEAHFVDKRLPLIYASDTPHSASPKPPRGEWEAFMDSLPSLPANGDLEALYTPNESCLAPLDNPHNWNAGTVKSFFRHHNITPAFLSRETPNGSSISMMLENCLTPKEQVAFFNSKGISMNCERLLQDGRPGPLLQRWIKERGGVEAVFSETNWLGQDVADMRTMYHALPDKAKARVKNYLTLGSKMSAAAGRLSMGRGR